mgnify:FL=1
MTKAACIPRWLGPNSSVGPADRLADGFADPSYLNEFDYGALSLEGGRGGLTPRRGEVTGSSTTLEYNGLNLGRKAGSSNEIIACKHSCADKRKCGHKCCKFGVKVSKSKDSK